MAVSFHTRGETIKFCSTPEESRELCIHTFPQPLDRLRGNHIIEAAAERLLFSFFTKSDKACKVAFCLTFHLKCTVNKWDGACNSCLQRKSQSLPFYCLTVLSVVVFSVFLEQNQHFFSHRYQHKLCYGYMNSSFIHDTHNCMF